MPTGADKDEFGVEPAVFTGSAVENCQGPTAVALTGQVADVVTGQHAGAVAYAVADELSGQRTEVDVGPVSGPIERDGFGKVAFGGHVGQSAGEFVGVLDPPGAAKKRVGGRRLAPAPR